jgi:transcriptional antiterminator RfaH
MSGLPAWYVVQSHPREELHCAEELARRGITAYCPMVREYRARRRRDERGPLFPSYLFARLTFPEEYHLLQWCRGVRRLVRFGETIPTLDPVLVESLFERTGPDGLVDLEMDLAEGDRVRFRTGPFRDLIGTVLRCDSPRGRVLVLMELLAGEAKVTVDKNLVLAI